MSLEEPDEVVDIDPNENRCFLMGLNREGVDFVLRLEEALFTRYGYEDEEADAIRVTMANLCDMVERSQHRQLNLLSLLDLGLQDYPHLVYAVAAESLFVATPSPMAQSVSDDGAPPSGFSRDDNDYADDFEEDESSTVYDNNGETVNMYGRGQSYNNRGGVSGGGLPHRRSPEHRYDEKYDEGEEKELLFIPSAHGTPPHDVYQRPATSVQQVTSSSSSSSSTQQQQSQPRPRTTPPQLSLRQPGLASQSSSSGNGSGNGSGSNRMETAHSVSHLPPIKYSDGPGVLMQGGNGGSGSRIESKSIAGGDYAGVSSSSVKSNRSSRKISWISEKRWVKGDKIGQGSFGEVFQGMDDKGKLFAVKVLNMTGKTSEINSLAEEIELMRDLMQENIVRYIGTWIDGETGTVNIFQEWVPGGSVAHLLKKFGPFHHDVVRNYTRQVLCGLKYLHENGVVHRDIKGGNILVDDKGTVKLADFGASRKFDLDGTQATQNIKGTPYFMAPEVLAENRYGRKGDIWAVGCTMIQMLTGEPPWKDMNVKTLVQLHVLLSSWSHGPPPYDREVSADCRLCLEDCFRKDESSRPSAVQLLDSPFLRDAMEDSANSANGDGSLEESVGMNTLRQQLERAVSSSVVGPLTSNRDISNKSDDTVAAIDRKIEEKKVRNPYAKGATSVSRTVVEAASRGSTPVASPHDLVPAAFTPPPVVDTGIRGQQQRSFAIQQQQQKQQQQGGGVRVTTGGGSGNNSPRYAVGDIINANYKGRGVWYPGVISQDRRDGTYDIDYDDGDREAQVSADRIHIMGPARPTAQNNHHSSHRTAGSQSSARDSETLTPLDGNDSDEEQRQRTHHPQRTTNARAPLHQNHNPYQNQSHNKQASVSQSRIATRPQQPQHRPRPPQQPSGQNFESTEDIHPLGKPSQSTSERSTRNSSTARGPSIGVRSSSTSSNRIYSESETLNRADQYMDIPSHDAGFTCANPRCQNPWNDPNHPAYEGFACKQCGTRRPS